MIFGLRMGLATPKRGVAGGGVGSNIFVNGDFSTSDIALWGENGNVATTVVDGRLNCKLLTNLTCSWTYELSGLTIGNEYSIDYELFFINIDSQGVRCRVNTLATQDGTNIVEDQRVASGAYTTTFTATAETLHFGMLVYKDYGEFQVDNISMIV